MHSSWRPLASLVSFLLCVACAAEKGEDDLGAPPESGTGGAAAGGTNSGSGGLASVGGTGGTTGSCTAMCEREVTMLMPVQTATCAAAAYVSGQAYTGGQTVSLDGNEYTAKYWTDTSPAGSTGDGAWSAPTPCPTETTMQEVTTTEMVCCDSQGGTGGSSAGGTGGSSAGGTGGASPQTDCVLDAYLPGGEADFKTIMAAPWPNPKIHAVFADAYDNLCKALEHSGFSNFAQGGSDDQNKRELAAFLANVAIETAYLQDSAQNADYTSTAFTIGRGAVQLTYEYNYQDAADYLGDQSIMADPRLVATDPVLVWETALWFWLHYENPSVQKPNNCHEAIKAGDFGRTLRIIKGDCGSLSDRVTAYEKGIGLMGVTAGDTTCEG